MIWNRSAVCWDRQCGSQRQSAVCTIADVLSPPGAPVADRLYQIMHVDEQTGVRQLEIDGGYEIALSRDGKQRIFLRWHANLAAFTLNSAGSDGGGEREVIPYGAFLNIVNPRFSPDGRRIIFASTTGPVTDPQGNPLSERTQSPVDGLLSLFTPEAAEAHASLLELWIINTDGTGLRRLTHMGLDTPMAVFSPDGTHIIIMDANGIYLMNADGTSLRKIDPLGDHGGLDWAASLR